MNLETAKKALEYFINRSLYHTNNQKPAITFYGGEPILNLDLLKKIVEYVKEKRVYENYNFSFTTNGTLFTQKIIDYFIKNDISILISLDGPKNINDRYRKFRNGRGSFDLIIENINKIKNKSLQYYINNISFNVTLAPPFNFEEVENFFYINTLFKYHSEKIIFNFIDSYETSFFRDFNLANRKALRENLIIMLNRFKLSLINGKHEDLILENKIFLKDFYHIYYRESSVLSMIIFPKGACFPGLRRLFVDADGNFFMCERVGANYKIGDINNGFNFKKIMNFFKKYVIFFSDCSNCWALRICSKCFNDVRKGEEFNRERKEDFCRNKKKLLEKYISIYCEILEKNTKAFKFLDNVIIR